MKFLITGVAGFIGFHTARYLLRRGDVVIGIDNVNSYYDPLLKEARLSQLQNDTNFSFHRIDITDKDKLDDIFRQESPPYVIHLAAQAGVRYSLENPYAYINSNITGFMNILEACRHYPVKHLVFASTSSVYGANTLAPFSVEHNVDHPLSLYGATKKSNELMAHAYSHLYGIPVSGLRFFTVYGPWGRPDMALYIFTRQILNGETIHIFNNGKHKRDFTYIDDIVEGMIRLTGHVAATNPDWDSAAPDPATSKAPYRLYNIGNHSPVELNYFIELIEKNLGKKADKSYLPLQPGDMVETWADVDRLSDAVAWSPSTPVETGIEKFIEWYKNYHKI